MAAAFVVFHATELCDDFYSLEMLISQLAAHFMPLDKMLSTQVPLYVGGKYTDIQRDGVP